MANRLQFRLYRLAASTPIDQRLLGTVVAAYDSNAGHFKKPSPHHSLVIFNDPENNTLMAAGSFGSLGFGQDLDRHCVVLRFRAGLFVPEPYTGGWAIGELDLKRTHSCYDSSNTLWSTFESKPEFRKELAELDLESIDNLYAPFFYKVMSIGEFGKEVGKKFPGDLNLNDIFSFHEIEESTARIVLISFLDFYETKPSDGRARMLDRLSTKKNPGAFEPVFFTDNAHAIKQAMFKFIRESDTWLLNSVDLVFVLIPPNGK